MQRTCQTPNTLTQFCKQQELSSLHEDQCYIDRRDYDSRRPFGLATWHWHPYGSEVRATCYPGQFYWDGHVSGSNVDYESHVNRYPGLELTNANVPQQLPGLPIQLPRVRGWFHADTESNLRGEANFNKKQCTRTTEKTFIPNRFQHFDHLCYDPQDPEYVIPEDTFNCTFPRARYWHRAGEDTRHDRQSRYRNGCDWKVKYFPANLSYSNFGY